MSDMPPRSSNGFTTKFLPGLVLGLVVGGLAGAFIPSAMEAMSGPALPAGKGSKPTTPNEREGRGVPTPVETKPTEVKPPDAKPPETSPPADSKPAEKPAEPAPAPPTAPK